MDFYSLISLGLDKTLRCFVCKKFLSYFPISLCSNNQSLCGRCAVPEGLISFQDEAFETICQFLKFPCRYQSDGCSEELVPSDVAEHEKICPFRTVQCFINRPLQCTWKGSLPCLLPHCRNEHFDLILKDGEFHMDLSVSDECDNLLGDKDVLFVFTRRFDLTSGILNCALEMNFTDLSLHSIISGDKPDSCLCRIKIGKIQSEEHRLERVRTGSTILSVLKCSMCFEYALLPIYRCTESMSTICSDCRDKHRSYCSICSQSTTRKSDTALEEIANLVQYPCKYQKNGCKSTLECCERKLHHDVCDYRIDECPFSLFKICEWKGLNKDINGHVLSSHQKLLVNSFDELELSEKRSYSYKLIQFANCLFRLAYSADGEYYNWSVETIGSCEEKFKFEIDLVDESNSGRRMSWRQCCGKLTDRFWHVRANKAQICDFFKVKSNGAALKFHVLMFK